MTRRRAPSLLAAVAFFASGCMHYSADLPGVLDLRSDGSEAPPPSQPLVLSEDVSREGIDAVLEGAGVMVQGDYVRVEERHAWMGFTALGRNLFLVFNPDAAPELEAALGENGALRNVYVGHQLDVVDAVVTAGENLVISLVCPPAALALSLFAPISPRMSFVATGERVSTVPGGRPSPLDLGEEPGAEDEGAEADAPLSQEPGALEPGAPEPGAARDEMPAPVGAPPPPPEAADKGDDK